jgi:hypothetical protein
MTDINQEQVDQLVDTLNNLPLEEPQRALLNGILWVVAEIREQTDEELAFASEFAHAFTKAKADLVLEYAAATQEPTGPHMITRHTATTPPSIIRNPPTPPNPDDEN